MGNGDLSQPVAQHDGLYGFNPQSYDEMLPYGAADLTVATDDNHNREPFDSPLCDSFGGFVMVKAGSLDYWAVIEETLKKEIFISPWALNQRSLHTG